MINLLNQDLDVYLDLNTFEISLKKKRENVFQIPVNYYRTDKEWSLKRPYIYSKFTEQINSKVSVRFFAPLCAKDVDEEDFCIDKDNFLYLNVYTSYCNVLIKVHRNNLKKIFKDLYENKEKLEEYCISNYSNYKLEFEKEDWEGDSLEYNIFTSKNIEYIEARRFLDLSPIYSNTYLPSPENPSEDGFSDLIISQENSISNFKAYKALNLRFYKDNEDQQKICIVDPFNSNIIIKQTDVQSVFEFNYDELDEIVKNVTILHYENEELNDEDLRTLLIFAKNTPEGVEIFAIGRRENCLSNWVDYNNAIQCDINITGGIYNPIEFAIQTEEFAQWCVKKLTIVQMVSSNKEDFLNAGNLTEEEKEKIKTELDKSIQNRKEFAELNPSLYKDVPQKFIEEYSKYNWEGMEHLSNYINTFATNIANNFKLKI